MSDHADANVVGQRWDSDDVGYGTNGAENGVRTDEGGYKWACWLSPSPVFSVFGLFLMSMGSSGMEDSGTKGSSAWEVGVFVFSITVSPAGGESRTCTLFGVSGDGR